MKTQQLTEKIYKRLSEKNICDVQGKIAIEVNLTGKIGGVFYIEILNGVLSVMPYEYIDRDASVSVAATNIEKIVAGKLDVKNAIDQGKLKVDGNVDKLFELENILKS